MTLPGVHACVYICVFPQSLNEVIGSRHGHCSHLIVLSFTLSGATHIGDSVQVEKNLNLKKTEPVILTRVTGGAEAYCSTQRVKG